MRDKKRISTYIKKLKKIWEQHPDLRLGQLILNAVKEDNLYYIEDGSLFRDIENLYKDSNETTK